MNASLCYLTGIYLVHSQLRFYSNNAMLFKKSDEFWWLVAASCRSFLTSFILFAVEAEFLHHSWINFVESEFWTNQIPLSTTIL